MRAFSGLIALSMSAIASLSLAAEVSNLSAPAVRGAIGERMHAYLRTAEQFGFSGVVLVAMDGEIKLHQAYGLADRQRQLPNRLDTVFSFGSIAKQFTGAAVMKLEQQGRLSTGDPITKYFENVPEAKAAITIHQLLTHTSGLADYHGVHDFQKMSRDTAIRAILRMRPIGKPGERFAYSNSGYTLAGAIVELVTGRDFVEYMKAEVFEPAGMTEAGFMGEEIWEAGRAARIYRGNKDRGSPPEKPGPFWVLLGNGGVCATVGQMYLWDRALRTEKILSDKSKRKIFTPYVNEYGYGWDVVTTPRGTTKHAHNGGSSLGLSAEFQRYVEEDGALILASNATIGDELAIETMVAPLSHLVFSDSEPQRMVPELHAVAPGQTSHYEGTFQLKDGSSFVIWRDAGQLLFGAQGQSALSSLDPKIKDQREEFDRLNSMAMSVLESTFAGNLQPLRARLSASDVDPQQRAARWSDSLKRWVSQSGKLGRIEVMGTGPVPQYSDDTIATWVRLHFAEETRICRLHWEEGRLRSLGGQALPYPFYGALRLHDDHRAFAFQFVSGRVLELELEADAAGVIQKLSAGSDRVQARRTQSPGR